MPTTLLRASQNSRATRGRPLTRDSLVETNVRFIADPLLEQKGFTQATDKPDIIIAILYESEMFEGYELRMLTLKAYRASDRSCSGKGQRRVPSARTGPPTTCGRPLGLPWRLSLRNSQRWDPVRRDRGNSDRAAGLYVVHREAPAERERRGGRCGGGLLGCLGRPASECRRLRRGDGNPARGTTAPRGLFMLPSSSPGVGPTGKVRGIRRSADS